jgi:hypothetical protein
MTATTCPNCGSTNLDLEQNTCLDCYRSLEPGASTGTTQTIEELQTASAAIDEALTPEKTSQALDAFETSVVERYQKGFRVVTLIGFSGAGKTFFAHRLRRELSLRNWSSEPEHKKEIPQTARNIEWTQLVKGGKPPHLRVLADCDGEAYSRSVEQSLDGVNLDPRLRRFVVITALASGFILMLPAAAMLDGKHEKTNELIERFDVIVKAILALRRSVRETGDPRETIRRGLQRDYVLNALEHEFQCDVPIHVLFAQADKLPRENQYHRDPHMYALQRANRLYHTIENRFTTFRFDFACAFDGYKENTDSRVDYNLPSYGTVAAFNWIDEMIDGGKLKRAQTAAAMKARRIVDSRFRKAAAKVAG